MISALLEPGPILRVGPSAAPGVVAASTRLRRSVGGARRRLRWPWVLSAALHMLVLLAAARAVEPSRARPAFVEFALASANLPADDAADADAEAIADLEPIEVWRVEPPPSADVVEHESLETPPPEEPSDLAAADEPTGLEPVDERPPSVIDGPPARAFARRSTPIALAPPPTPAPVAAPAVPTPPPPRAASAVRAPRRGAVVGARPYATNLPPVYPSEAARLGITGVVTLLLRIDESGLVSSVSIAVSSGSPLLDAAATSAAERWRFEPARTDDGSPVAVTLRQRVGFAPP